MLISNSHPTSPLRYPGGKSRAVKTISAFIPSNETKLCSPFLGGGSVELASTSHMEVHGYDIFDPLVAFWQILLRDPEALIREVERFYPLARDDFYELQRNHIKINDPIEMAAAFYVLNRSSFSGTTLSGGMSPGHPRFTPSSIERLKAFKVNNFFVEKADFRDAIPTNPDAFLYLDPPYLNGQALYGIKGGTHKDFDHNALAALLHERGRWILSYNDCEEVRKLYNNYRIIEISWTYGMNSSKRSSEVLILSQDLTSKPELNKQMSFFQ